MERALTIEAVEALAERATALHDAYAGVRARLHDQSAELLHLSATAPVANDVAADGEGGGTR